MKAELVTRFKTLTKVALLTTLILSANTPSASAAGSVNAELRSAANILPALGVGMFVPTAPAGGIMAGPVPWTCDAAQGFAPLVNADSSIDPLLAVGKGVHLPILGNVAPAACGQLAYDGSSNVYVSQGVLANNTPASATGILRLGIDPVTGQINSSETMIAVNSGLGGNRPTALAIGPDGNLYFGNLKNGDIKRIVNPGIGTTQVVQSVGKSPNGHPLRAMAFVGNDLYLGSMDSLSVISNATSASCTGGCTATALIDGFGGLDHVGVTSDRTTTVYFAIAGNINQVWKYTPASKTFTLVASGGVDRTGADAGKFSFVAGKSNLLSLDGSGNLWIGDDTNNGITTGAGRIWTIASALLATVSGGTVAADPQIVAALKGPWFVQLGSYILSATFNADGSFTANIQAPGGTFTPDTGTYRLSGPVKPLAIGNAQAHLNLTDLNGAALFDGDVLLLNADQLASEGSTNSFSDTPSIGGFVIWSKQTI